MMQEEAVKSILRAINPMRVAIAKRYHLWLKEVVADFDAEMIVVHEEITTALKTTVIPEDPNGSWLWIIPSWLGPGVRPYAASLEMAMKECVRHLGHPYMLASRKHPERRGPAHRMLQNWWTRGFQYSKKRGHLPKVAETMADDAIAAMVAKLANKIDGIGDLKDHRCEGGTLDCFTLRLFFNDRTPLAIFTNLTINNRQGRPYFQWPSRIYEINPNGSIGRMIPAAELKS